MCLVVWITKKNQQLKGLNGVLFFIKYYQCTALTQIFPISALIVLIQITYGYHYQMHTFTLYNWITYQT